MERKSKVTQAAVNTACDQLQADNQNITMNAVISICGGSFSTIGAMVKAWKEEQAAHVAPLLQMPDSVMGAMHKAAADIWGAASGLAGETVERIQSEAGEAISKAKAELAEYAGEVTRLERELEQVNLNTLEIQKKLDTVLQDNIKSTSEVAAMETRLTERDSQLSSLKVDYDKLQGELIDIAKSREPDVKPATRKRTPKSPAKKSVE